jgi:two-component system, OmpR family, sensor kinase
MVQAGRAGFWRSIKDLPGHMPLRTKLTAAVLALVAVALLVISVAGIGFLRNYLTSQADNGLSSIIDSGQPPPQNYVAHFLGGGPQQTASQVAIDWLPARGHLVQVVQPSRNYGPNSEPGPAVVPGASWLSSGQPATVAAASGPGHWRVVAYPWTFHTLSGQSVNGTIILGIDFSSASRTITELTGIDVIVSGLLLLVLAVVGIAVVRRSLRPLTDIEKTAGAIAAGDLSRRVPERDPKTEVGRLGRSLNVMLSQIETAFHARSQSEASARRSEEKMRQFVADASHELRTPLTAIRGFAEYYRQRGGVDTGGSDSGHLAPADLDRIMRRVEQEASRMGILVEDMLLLARLDQQRPLEARPVDLLSLAADAVHDARVVAPDRSVNLTVGSGAALLVIGDEVRLRQVIGNLMSNALTHTPDGTPIDVLIRSGNLDEAPVSSPPPPPPDAPPADDSTTDDSTTDDSTTDDSTASETTASGSTEAEDTAAENGDISMPAGASLDAEHPSAGRPAAVLEVADHGPGLTREHAEHVFERFYRADQSRTAGGTGLGLAIVAALVAAHGGVAWVRSHPSAGATFCIALPLSPDAVHGSDDDLDAEDAPDSGAPDDADQHARSHDDSWFSADAPDPVHGQVT